MLLVGIIQSKAQLKVLVQNARPRALFTNVRSLKNMGCIYIPSPMLLLLVLLPFQCIVGDVRSNLTQVRLFMHRKRTIVLSDGIGNIVARKAMKGDSGLYYSYEEMKFISRYIGKRGRWPLTFVEYSTPSLFRFTNKTYFIGQALSENYLVDMSEEIDKITSEDFDFYIAHPKDSDLKLSLLSQVGVESLRILEPAEDYLINNGFECLMGFSSSVLWNLRFSKRIKVVPIEYRNTWLGVDCREAEKILLEICVPDC